jgi:cell division protein FtsW
MANPPRIQTAPKSGPTGNFSTRFKLAQAFSAESPNFYLLAGTTILTVIFGLLMVLSASAVDSFLQNGGFFNAFTKQFGAAAIGIPAMLFISRLPMSAYRRFANALLILSGVMQLLVFTPLGYESGGNRNWLNLGFITAQPSEFIKLTIAIWLGVYLPPIIQRNGRDNWRVLVPLIPVAILLVLVLAGGDLGTVIILYMIILGCLVFSGVAKRIIAIPVMLGGFFVIVLAITSPNRMARILSFLNANCVDYTNACWQPLHGKWALANGGFFGVGLGQSKAKWSWLPAADNDYIFAIIGEELGMIGALVVIGLFVVLTVAFLRIIRKANDPLVRIATGGIMVWIVGEAFINIGVVLGVLPVLGVPLPLLSNGGTALITTLAAIGVVLSFTQGEPAIKPPRPRARPAAGRPAPSRQSVGRPVPSRTIPRNPGAGR